MKIIIDDKIPFISGAFDKVAEVVYLPGAEFSNAAVKNADALIIRTRTHCNKELLHGSAVKFIATATIGYDHIDTDYCAKAGIKWTNAPGCNSYSVLQYFASTVLFLAKDMKFDLSKRTIGIVGIGNVGSKIYAFLNSIKVKTILNDPPLQEKIQKVNKGTANNIDTEFVNSLPEFIKNAQFSSLDFLIENADIITFHVPLVTEKPYSTFHLCDMSFLDKLTNKNAIIINTSRGEVVDNSALKYALKKQLISGAALDVWENEPNIDAELLDLLNIATPHIAGYSADGKAKGTSMSVQAVSIFFNLGLDNWIPSNIPSQLNSPTIKLTQNLNSDFDILRNIIYETYDVRRDDENLRANIKNFEYLRGHYPIRREPNAFSVINQNYSDNLIHILEQLRFNIKNRV